MRYQDLNYSLGDTVFALCHSSGTNGFIADAPVFVDENLCLVECQVVGTSGPAYGSSRPEFSTSIKLMGTQRAGEVMFNYGLTRNYMTAVLRSLRDNMTITDEQREFLRKFVVPVPVASRGYMRMLEDITRTMHTGDEVPQCRTSEVDEILRRSEELGIPVHMLTRTSPMVSTKIPDDTKAMFAEWDAAGEPTLGDYEEDDEDETEAEREEF